MSSTRTQLAARLAELRSGPTVEEVRAANAACLRRMCASAGRLATSFRHLLCFLGMTAVVHHHLCARLCQLDRDTPPDATRGP